MWSFPVVKIEIFLQASDDFSDRFIVVKIDIRKDGHHPIVFMNCGPVRYKVDDRKQAYKRPFIHKIIVRQTDFRLPKALADKESLAIHELYAALISDDKRHRLNADDVVAAVKAHRFPVLLTERRQHLDKMAKILEPQVRNLFVMKGGNGKETALESFG